MKKRIVSSVLALSIVLGGNGVVFGGVQAAGAENKGASNKAAGLAIGGSCLATGLVAGILGGVCLTKSYNDEAATFAVYFLMKIHKLKTLAKNISRVTYSGELISGYKIFDKKYQDIIDTLKNGLSGFKTYFTLGGLKKSLLDDTIDQKQIDKNNKEEIQKLKDTIDKTIPCIANLCNLYEGFLSRYDREKLSGLCDGVGHINEGKTQLALNVFGDSAFKDLQSVSKELIDLLDSLSL